MRPIAILILLALSTAALAGCSHSGANGDQAAIDTSHGCILIEFYEDEAPETVDNFIAYAEDDFYQGTIFHRIIQSFMIQGGGFTANGQQKETRDPIALEYEVPNERGTVAMARTPEPDSATSQFFINTVDNTQNLGPNAQSDGYAVFAQVVEGMNVVDAIAAEPTGRGPAGQENWPQDPPVIEGVRVGEDCGEQEEEDPEEPVVEEAGEYIPFWVLNVGEEDATFTLDLETPDGWNVSLESETLDLNAGGESGDAAASYILLSDFEQTDGDESIRLTVTDSNDSESNIELEIRPLFEAPAGDWNEFGATEGPAVQAGLITNSQRPDGVWETFVSTGRVSAPGDGVTLSYVGSFDDGEEFDSGSFSTTVRSGQTVAGFDTGLLGLEEAETVDLRFPPETAYGYEPGPGREQFAGEWLNFEITLESFGN